MERLKRATIYLLACAVLITCKKEHLPPATTAGQPVFMFNGTINSSSVSLQAGVNNYYMYSSYTQDANNVYNFMGTLKSTQTNNNSLQFIINDYKVSAANASANIDTSLVGAYYSLNRPSGSPTSYTVVFDTLIGNGTPLSYAYSFGDGTTSSLAMPTHKYFHPGNYSTSLSVSFLSSCTTTLANVIKLGTPGATLMVSRLLPITKDSVTDSLVVFVAGGTPPYHYKWNFGDGSPSKETTIPYVSHSYSVAGMYTASLSLSDAVGDTTNYNANILTPNYSSSCLANYFPLIQADTNNPLSLSNVTIEYTDGAGNVYSSKNTLQPGSSYFKITSVAPYQNNDNNQTTKMLNVQFSCLLYPTSGSPIPASGTAVIAVAYQ